MTHPLLRAMSTMAVGDSIPFGGRAKTIIHYGIIIRMIQGNDKMFRVVDNCVVRIPDDILHSKTRINDAHYRTNLKAISFLPVGGQILLDNFTKYAGKQARVVTGYKLHYKRFVNGRVRVTRLE